MPSPIGLLKANKFSAMHFATPGHWAMSPVSPRRMIPPYRPISSRGTTTSGFSGNRRVAGGNSPFLTRCASWGASPNARLESICLSIFFGADVGSTISEARVFLTRFSVIWLSGSVARQPIQGIKGSKSKIQRVQTGRTRNGESFFPEGFSKSDGQHTENSSPTRVLFEPILCLDVFAYPNVYSLLNKRLNALVVETNYDVR